MSNDIFTLYTKEQKKLCGRYGYINAFEKIINISPKNYGIFVMNRKKRMKIFNQGK